LFFFPRKVAQGEKGLGSIKNWSICPSQHMATGEWAGREHSISDFGEGKKKQGGRGKKPLVPCCGGHVPCPSDDVRVNLARIKKEEKKKRTWGARKNRKLPMWQTIA